MYHSGSWIRGKNTVIKDITGAIADIWLWNVYFYSDYLRECPYS